MELRGQRGAGILLAVVEDRFVVDLHEQAPQPQLAEPAELVEDRVADVSHEVDWGVGAVAADRGHGGVHHDVRDDRVELQRVLRRARVPVHDSPDQQEESFTSRREAVVAADARTHASHVRVQGDDHRTVTDDGSLAAGRGGVVDPDDCVDVASGLQHPDVDLDRQGAPTFTLHMPSSGSNSSIACEQKFPFLAVFVNMRNKKVLSGIAYFFVLSPVLVLGNGSI